MQPFFYDIAVVGGGASGLAAAIEAIQYGGTDCRVAVIEKNAVLGKKLLATGNGRCNLGNIEEGNPQHYSGSCSELVQMLFRKFEGSENFFKALGVICRSDNGRLYPYSNHASSVLDSLRFRLIELGADVFTDTEATDLNLNLGLWEINTNIKKITAKKIIVSCGGKSSPVFGSDGSFYRTLKNINNYFTPIKPALCPAHTDPLLLIGLKGIRIIGKASLYSSENELLHSDIGEVQLTDKTLSGICVFNLAAFAKGNDMYIELDLMPYMTITEVHELLWEIYAQRSSWKLHDMLTGIFQKKLCHALFKSSDIAIDENFPVYSLTPYDMNRIANTIKSWKFPVLYFGDWQQSQVTAGGIARDEIYDTLESKHCTGVYFSGEILDIVGECGGYNLAWAWCSGVCAARNAVDSLKKDKS